MWGDSLKEGKTYCEEDISTLNAIAVFIPYRQAAHQKSEKEAVRPPQSQTDGTILVVEDNRINRLVVETMLRKAGYKVTTAKDGKEALPFLEQNPHRDGITAIRAIREYERENNQTPLPIIALTAAGTSDDERTMLEAGSNDFHEDYISEPPWLFKNKNCSGIIKV